jgi:hypothetical protein
MFGNPSLMTRIAIGKVIGFLFGFAGFIFLPYFLPDASMLLRWGILLWYTTVGAIIGVFGVLTYHPVLRLPMPWWFRAPLIGAWMNFVSLGVNSRSYLTKRIGKSVQIRLFRSHSVLSPTGS